MIKQHIALVALMLVVGSAGAESPCPVADRADAPAERIDREVARRLPEALARAEAGVSASLVARVEAPASEQPSQPLVASATVHDEKSPTNFEEID